MGWRHSLRHKKTISVIAGASLALASYACLANESFTASDSNPTSRMIEYPWIEVMGNFFHPTVKGYQIRVDAMLPDLQQLMK